MLEFLSMVTECSYDYLFIYDGNSYNDTLLGSFSGETIPDKLLASSGHVSNVIYCQISYYIIYLK